MIPKKVAVIGVGNILLKDEGIGIYAAKYIAENFLFLPSVNIIDGGTLGFKLIGYFQNYDKVIIMDTISTDDVAGSIYDIPSKVLMGMGKYRRTAHEVEVVEMLEICSTAETMAEVNVIGIVPEDIRSVEINLTDELKNHFHVFVRTAVNQIEKTGFKTEYKRGKRSLNEIIRLYNFPHAQRPFTGKDVSEKLI